MKNSLNGFMRKFTMTNSKFPEPCVIFQSTNYRNEISGKKKKKIQKFYLLIILDINSKIVPFGTQ